MGLTITHVRNEISERVNPIWWGLVIAVSLLIVSGSAMAVQNGQQNESTIQSDKKINNSELGIEKERLTLVSLGVKNPVKLASRDGIDGVAFSFKTLDIVGKLRVKLRISYSPLMSPEKSSLILMLNGKQAGQVGLDKFAPNDGTAEFEIDPMLLQEWNYLNYKIDGHLIKPCDDPRDPAIWLLINNKDSYIEADVATLPMGNDLSFFPVPFFDRHDPANLILPIVFAGKPSVTALQSAAIFSTWFGALTTWRKAEFPISYGAIPDANAIVLAKSGDVIDGITIPNVSEGSVVSEIVNPINPENRLLLVVGHSDNDLVVAAQAVTTGKVKMEGESQTIGSKIDLPKRRPMEAPNWLKKNSKIALGSLTKPEELRLQGWFITPVSLNANFPPNIFRSGYTTLPIDLLVSSSNKGRYLSKVVTFINGVLFSTIKLDKIDEDLRLKRMSPHRLRLEIPTVNITGKDNLTFEFTFSDAGLVTCPIDPTYDEITIDPNSAIDLASMPEFVELANLSYFAYSGFPYSKMDDLSETTVVLPKNPSQSEIETMLNVLGHIGNRSGYPGTGLTVVSLNSADKIKEIKDKDLIVIGSDANLKKLKEKWKDYLPVDLQEKYQPFPNIGYDFVQRWKNWSHLSSLLAVKDEDPAVFAEFEAPSTDGRTALMIIGDTPDQLKRAYTALNDWDKAKDFIGDVSLVNKKGRVSSFQILKKYPFGSLPLQAIGIRLISHNPWISVLAGMIVALLFGALAFRRLDQEGRDRLSQWRTVD